VWLNGCAGPAAPQGMLPAGRWSGDGACVSVAADGCDLVIGCGHGQFPPPVLRADGTFDVQGRYRIEVGPISIDPAPPATFSGALKGDTLTIRVVPDASGVPAGPYVLKRTGGAGRCAVPCL
jgi:hypothetical protein